MAVKNFQQNTSHIVLKKHHKWMIGGISSIVLVYMIVSAILLNGIIVKQTINHNKLSDRLNELQADTQNKLNELTEEVIKTRTDLDETQTSLSSQIGSIDEEFDLLKTSSSGDFSEIIKDAIKSVVTIKTDVSQGT